MSEFSKDYYLNRIVYEIRSIRSFVEGYSFNDYADDLKTQYACERAILNLSETVRNFEKHGQRNNPDFHLKSISPDIEWAKIKGVGNVMRHDYENVTNSRVWGVITDHLEALEKICLDALDS